MVLFSAKKDLPVVGGEVTPNGNSKVSTLMRSELGINKSRLIQCHITIILVAMKKYLQTKILLLTNNNPNLVTQYFQ